ncbi:endonuclease/exonuclease/phosphatase family protein [Bacillus thuringiensis]|uniref:endonuclease/exonuclease/phosphatase family protein n=1 Tax=Bacillus thuringiensis TaxID=1428 RepID=UPI001EDEB551|nr:endonuclease/exonuclease/phosphatase family protein [Bacillus thuringiensis]MCG3424279.1 endonuclease/exonuclease/phosphatase family protein [Bacillus thuringiensis]
MKKLLKIVLICILVGAGIVGGFLGYMTLTKEQPADVVSLKVGNNKERVLAPDNEFKVTTFNIGYAGLDKDQDFFMDGGKGSGSSSKEQTEVNLKNMLSFLQNENSDFALLQEVDIKSMRSFDVNGHEFLKKGLPDYASSFGKNYDTKWVPVPITSPMGYAEAGLSTFSKYKVQTAERFQLPGMEPWPKRLFDLDRAIVEHKIPVNNGKFVRLVNLHLSAYDEGGKIRKQQVEFLKEYMNKHYKNGDYVIMGGDWNQLLSSAQLSDPKFVKERPEWLVELPKDFTDGGFKWAVDPSVMTVRDDVKKYVEGENFVTIIDGFIVSPNVEIVNVQGKDLKFENSDHNPVSAVFKLK